MLGCMLMAVGCAPKTPAPRQAEPAQLVVSNVTNYAWNLTITPAGGGAPRREHVPPRAELNLKLPGGSYDIEQAVEAAPATPELTRRISCRLEPGRTYRWRLATLLSTGPSQPP